MNNVKGKNETEVSLSEINESFDYPDCSEIPQGELRELAFRYGEAGDHSSLISRQWHLREVFIAHYKISLTSEKAISLKRNTDAIQMYFVLKGKLKYKLPGGNDKIIPEMSHNMMYQSGEDMEVTLPADEEMEFIELQLLMPFVNRYVSKNQVLQSRLNTGKSVLLADDNLPLSAQLHRVLHELMGCEFEGYLKGLYIQGKVIELMSLQLVQMEDGKKVEQSGLKKEDILKMNTVRALITSNPEKTFSLASLARAAGTNEQYLKSHFKQVYGNTVFGYLTAYRMQLALDMLGEGNKKIAEIAEAVGYRHSTHFSQAFKKHFGYLPNSVKG